MSSRRSPDLLLELLKSKPVVDLAAIRSALGHVSGMTACYRNRILTRYRPNILTIREANRRLSAERPAIEKEIDQNSAEATRCQAAMDRYFQAFEAGKLEPDLCNEKVRDLRPRLEELQGERRDLEARRQRLELPTIDREMLAALVDNFEQVMTEGPTLRRGTSSAGW